MSESDSNGGRDVLSVSSGGRIDLKEKDKTTGSQRPEDLPLTRESRRSLMSTMHGLPPDEKQHRRPTAWTEDMLEALEPHEHDFQEFKGTGWLLRSPGEIQPDFLYFLSKQVSAFVNGSGGLLFVGINDEGKIDGGVPTMLKGGGTRAWLEDLVSACVSPTLPRCNVFEVKPRTDGSSAILMDHAVYVIELPASQDAPHQSKDHRYYLRIAGKSRPMGHVHVQDVLRRTFHPRVELTRFGPYGDVEFDTSDARGPKAFVQFRVFVTNLGRTLARHVGIELDVPRPFAGTEVRNRMREAEETHYTQSPGRLSYFRYHPTPLFPTQSVYGLSVWVCIHGRNIAQIQAGSSLDWTVYADDARPLHGSQKIGDFQIVQRTIDWVISQQKSGSE